MKKGPSLFLLCVISMIMVWCRSGFSERSEVIDTLYSYNDTVTITGILHRSRYLSVMEGSRKEYVNITYILDLERPVTITTNPKIVEVKFKTLEKILWIEVMNTFDFDFEGNLGKRMILAGTLSPITEMPGFHRQVSTPVQIHVTKIIVLEDRGGSIN